MASGLAEAICNTEGLVRTFLDEPSCVSRHRFRGDAHEGLAQIQMGV